MLIANFTAINSPIAFRSLLLMQWMKNSMWTIILITNSMCWDYRNPEAALNGQINANSDEHDQATCGHLQFIFTYLQTVGSNQIRDERYCTFCALVTVARLTEPAVNNSPHDSTPK